jgi:hypothetical protein
MPRAESVDARTADPTDPGIDHCSAGVAGSGPTVVFRDLAHPVLPPELARCLLANVRVEALARVRDRVAAEQANVLGCHETTTHERTDKLNDRNRSNVRYQAVIENKRSDLLCIRTELYGSASVASESVLASMETGFRSLSRIFPSHDVREQRLTRDFSSNEGV